MKILLTSLAARGHAIADALSRSSHNPEIISVVPARNPGIAKIASEVHETSLMDFDAVCEIAKNSAPDFAFIAPDDPIGEGLVDRLQAMGIPCIAPTKALAQIEASKGFTRDLMQKYNIDASPEYHVVTENNPDAIHTLLENLEGNYVVKYDGLRGGKGVKVSGDHLATIDDGAAYAIECIEECGCVVIEEKLIGVEFSLISLVSGAGIAHTPAIQDHKRAHLGDTGPNTGGMGTYSDSNHSLPFLTDQDLSDAKNINELIAEAVQKECGEVYKGVLYGGFIVTKKGVQVIEYNARFGDPEALNIFPLLETDFVDVCTAMLNEDLSEDSVAFKNLATVCKYITPDCYPESKDRRGNALSLPNTNEHTYMYYGDVSEDNSGNVLLGGSRSVGIVGVGQTIAEAEQYAQALCEQVDGPVRFREDIGTEELIQKRIDLLEQIRQG